MNLVDLTMPVQAEQHGVPTCKKSDLVRDHVHAVASVHPRASITAIGGRAEEICRDHWKAETAHGEGTPYVRMADLGGYVCLLGVDEDRNTTLHAVEELLRLFYLTTTDEVTFPTPEGEVTRSWVFFPGPHRDFIGLDRLLRQRGVLRLGRIGSGVVRLSGAGRPSTVSLRWAETTPPLQPRGPPCPCRATTPV